MGRGLVRYHVLFIIKLATREVKLAGLAPEPCKSWMLQVARNLIDPWTGFLNCSRYLIHDRGTHFCEHFREVLRSAQIDPLRLPARLPDLNAYAERFVWTIRQECLDWMVFIRKLRQAMNEFVLHYNQERNH